MKLYGIKTCDTCRKAIKTLEAADHRVDFIDLRADGFTDADLDRWLTAVGWEQLLNRRSTTWRDLPDADKANPDLASARALMRAHPTLIKRPVIEVEGEDGITVIVGFAKAQQAALLG